jgi:hypothetical protein
MKLYAFDAGTRMVTAIVNGESTEECERKANEAGYREDEGYGHTFSPAFGSKGGLIDDEVAEEIE